MYAVRSHVPEIIKQGRHVYTVVVGAIWTVDIGLGSSVVELLTRVAGVPGSIPGPAICFRCIYILIPPFLLQMVPWPSLFRHINIHVIYKS